VRSKRFDRERRANAVVIGALEREGTSSPLGDRSGMRLLVIIPLGAVVLGVVLILTAWYRRDDDLGSIGAWLLILGVIGAPLGWAASLFLSISR
jgi:hypothetical protein